MTPEEVALYLRKSTSWVYKNWKILGGRKLGGSLFFPKKEDLYERIFGKRKGVEVRLHPEGDQAHGSLVQNKNRGKKAEVERREELKNPKPVERTSTDMGFLELVNRRLDHVKAYNSERHYTDYIYLARRWTARWGDLLCNEITEDMVRDFVIERSSVSSHTANKEIRYLRATFNFGKKKKRWIDFNPADGVEFFPNNGRKKKKYVPPPEDIDKVIRVADPDTQDYLWVIRETMARVSEVNRLEWDDVHFEDRYITLHTRKKKGGNLTPRDVPMTDRLHDILERMYHLRDKTKPWIFWHRYWSKKETRFKEGPYQDRKKFMRNLCKKAGVPYFRFHPLRHSGASVLDNNHVPIGSIQRILGHENRKNHRNLFAQHRGRREKGNAGIWAFFKKVSHRLSHRNKKGLGRNDLNPCYCWRAQQDSNLRPTDS